MTDLCQNNFSKEDWDDILNDSEDDKVADTNDDIVQSPPIEDNRVFFFNSSDDSIISCYSKLL